MRAGSDFQESSIGEFKIDVAIHDTNRNIAFSYGFSKKVCNMSGDTEM